jgi:hypothetical protein
MDVSGAPGPRELVLGSEISPGDLILAGPAGDGWILQMASALTATEGRQVVLVGGAGGPSVFLQPGTSSALVTGPMPGEATDAEPSVTFIAGPTQDDAASTRTGAVAAGRGIAEETGCDIQWQ